MASVYQYFSGGQNAPQKMEFGDFITAVEKRQVKKVVINNNNISGEKFDGKKFSTEAPNYPELVQKLLDNSVKIDANTSSKGLFLLVSAILNLLPLLLWIGILLYFMKQMSGKGGGGAMSFGKSKAKLLIRNKNKVTFKDVAGIDEAKQELQEMVDYLKDPSKFIKIGGKIPKGVLLVGSPGTGKTLIARAVAGEAGVPFFSISGSDFVEMFVGVGASRVRDMFEQGRKNAPCIIFIDEIDAVGRHRGAGMGGGNDEREQTLNQMLVEMDGFEGRDGVIIIAATNRPDVLDPALLRPGRFDRQVMVSNPDLKGREAILKIHMKKIKYAPDIDSHVIARGTPGFSGADLANLVNEAALLAARKDKKVVTMQEMEEAKDKVMMGPERKSMVMDDEEKELTAYHEAGHAIVGLKLPASDPIHKATIVPRGRALGMVMRLPEKDRLSVTREKMKADLAVAMGGRVAEEIIFGYEKVTSGASSDIKYATNMARNMVTAWGLSDKIGPIYHGDSNHEPFLGMEMSQGKHTSEDTAKIIDEEVKHFVNEAYSHATKILTDFNEELHKLAKALLEYGTLTGEEIKKLLKEGDIGRSAKLTEDAKNVKGKKKRKTLPSIEDLVEEAGAKTGLQPQTDGAN